LSTSSFTSDLEKEKRLSVFLDQLYLNNLKNYSFVRETHLFQQHRGVDLVFKNKRSGEVFTIDEKAQLDYVNDDLPTFAFELSYQKGGIRKEGWLFDSRKKTQFYSLITGIYSDVPGIFTSAKITLVNRNLLIGGLNERGLFHKDISMPETHGKHELPQLDPKKEGYLFLSKKNKAEQPLNLILRLDFLNAMGAAKRLV
jgi:hypothetical protein